MEVVKYLSSKLVCTWRFPGTVRLHACHCSFLIDQEPSAGPWCIVFFFLFFCKTRKVSSFLATQKWNAPVRAVLVPRSHSSSLFRKDLVLFWWLLSSSRYGDITSPLLAFLQEEWPGRGVDEGHVLCPRPQATSSGHVLCPRPQSSGGRGGRRLLPHGSFVNLCPFVF